MSKFFSEKYKSLVPYTPGEQPQKAFGLIKLNTNESPFMPSKKAMEYAAEAAKSLNLYPDPECKTLCKKTAQLLGVRETQVLAVNGSDEILNFAFMAFCDERHPAAFADITYGFYSVFAELNRVPYDEIPLTDEFKINVDDYLGINKSIFIANPNAPTGIALTRTEIERILISNPENVVVVDEAYVDFGAESCVGLIDKYKNLLVTQTFSKSRSMAGARLGFGIACEELIADLNTVKYSTNPYNINRMTMAAGIGVLEEQTYTDKNCAEIIKNREFARRELEKMGFELTNSSANFLFAKSKKISGKELYLSLKERGIIVRWFDKERIAEYNRITVGTKEQMEAFIKAVREIISEKEGAKK